MRMLAYQVAAVLEERGSATTAELTLAIRPGVEGRKRKDSNHSIRRILLRLCERGVVVRDGMGMSRTDRGQAWSVKWRWVGVQA